MLGNDANQSENFKDNQDEPLSLEDQQKLSKLKKGMSFMKRQSLKP